ncbi:hypothetical protein [Thiocapsa sp. UBA6158]|jgi:hypothetical protein|uniref:hypothetical protein n=1 Tax=Thiocapsa sp. UBA6158 TaxID=1947692 RepID=UPI0025EF972D|nr:hypothetical protein [Thiocapsa sp. UBA6158]
MQKRAEIHAVPSDSSPKTPRKAPAPRRFRLTSARNVRRELSVLYAELRNGEVDPETCRTGAFLLRCVLESLRLDEFETRLDDLEESTR